jgi:hypothetical protein
MQKITGVGVTRGGGAGALGARNGSSLSTGSGEGAIEAVIRTMSR